MSIEESRILIDYILEHTDLNQSRLARKLNVSRAQVSKWKAGDYLSMERTSQLLKLAGLFDTVNVGWAIFAGSEENANAWYSYVLEILDDVEWGNSLKDFFQDMPDIYVGHLITDLCALGAKIEQLAPTKWCIDEYDEECWEPTPLASALWSVLDTWGQLRDWVDATLDFDDVMDGAESELFEVKSDIEWSTFELALGYVEQPQLTAIGVDETMLDAAVESSRQRILSSLHDICRIRTKHSLPITENYFQLLYLPPIDLAEQLWFRPAALGVGKDLIKSYLPYGQRLIIEHLEYSAEALHVLSKKLDRILATSRA